MIVKWNNNIVDYKCKFVFYFFQNATNPSFFFLMLVYVKKKKKKREHATYDIRDSYYKPVAPALCWYNPPGSTITPSGSRTWVSDAGGRRSNKERQRLQPLVSVARAPLFEVRRVRFTHRLYWHTHLLHWHPTVGINFILSDEPPEWVHIASRLKTGSALIAVWKGTASCSTF